MPSFVSLWFIYYVSVSINLQSKELFALECYAYNDRTEKVMCHHSCRYQFKLQEVQNFHWDLFLEKKLEVDQIVPHDEIDVPIELVSSPGCMDDLEGIENPQMSPQCKIDENNFYDTICFCNTNLCNENFKVPRNLIRNGGQQRGLRCAGKKSFVECPENQLCTIQLNVTKVEQVLKDNNIQGQQRIDHGSVHEELFNEPVVYVGCTQDPDPLLLNHTKGECAFNGDVTNGSLWTCRCNLDMCSSDFFKGKPRVFLTDDLSAFPISLQYDKSRIRCLSTEVIGTSDRSKPVIDDNFVWCQPNEVCTVRIDLLREREMQQGVLDEKSAVYQGCYNLSNERNVIVSEDGEDCRNIDNNPGFAWRCVCTTPLCNWYRHSKLTNTVPRKKKLNSFYCYIKRDGEVDMELIRVSGTHFCAVYVSFAIMEEEYQNYTRQTKLEDSAASLEEPLPVNEESIVYQDVTSELQLTISSVVGQVCERTFTKKENNELLWVCLCNISFCNAMEKIKFMPNELRQDKAVPTTTTGLTTTTGDRDKDDFVNKITACFLWWTIPVVRLFYKF